MTDYAAMSAGREMDAEVAEKVMGWTVQLIVGSRDVGTFEEWRDAQGWRYDLFPYSTDIAAAWQIVEKLKYVRLAYSADPPMSWLNAHVVVRVFNDAGDEIGIGTGATAPEAICRAALRAVQPARSTT